MKYLILIVSFLFFVVPTIAQEDSEATLLSGSYDITIPDDWEISSRTNVGYFWTTPDSLIRIRTYTPLFLVEFEFDDPEPGEVLEWLVADVFENSDFTLDQAETVDFGNYSGFGHRFEVLEEGVRFDQQLYLFEAEGGTMILGYIRPQDGADELNEDDVEAFLGALTTVTRRDTYMFYDGTSVDISDRNWLIVEEDTLGLAGFTLVNGSVSMDIGYWPRYAVIAGFEDPRDFLGYIWDVNYARYARYTRENLQEARIAGFDALFYPFDMETVNSRDLYARGVFVFELTGTNSYVTVVPMTEELDTDFDIIFDVLDTFTSGNRLVCPLFADPGVSIRVEPTTTSERVRQTGDEVLIAEYDTIGADGFRWFFVGEGWIRSDVIFFEINTCEGLTSR